MSQISANDALMKRAKVTECTVFFTKQIHQKTKTWHDGTLKFYHFNKKIRLYDEKEKLLAEEFIKKENQIQEKNVLTLNSYLVEVVEVSNTFERDLSGAFPERVRNNKKKQIAGDLFTPTHETSASNHKVFNDINRSLREIIDTNSSTILPQFSRSNKKVDMPFITNLKSSNPMINKRPYVPKKCTPTKVRSKTSNDILKSSPITSNTFNINNGKRSKITEYSTPSRCSNNIYHNSVIDSAKQGNNIDNKLGDDDIGIGVLKQDVRLPISDKYSLNKRRLFTSRRKSVFLVALPCNHSIDSSNIHGTSSCRKRPKSLTKIMKLSGPRRPIEIPKKLLDVHNSDSNADTNSDGNGSMLHDEFCLFEENDFDESNVDKANDAKASDAKANDDKMNNDKMINDKMNNDKMNNDKMNNDKMNNDKMNNDEMKNNKVNHDKVNDDGGFYRPNCEGKAKYRIKKESKTSDKAIKNSEVLPKISLKQETSDDISFELLRNSSARGLETLNANSAIADINGNPQFDVLCEQTPNILKKHIINNDNGRSLLHEIKGYQITPPQTFNPRRHEKFMNNINNHMVKQLKESIESSIASSTQNKSIEMVDFGDFSDDDFIDDDEDEERDESLNSIMMRLKAKKDCSRLDPGKQKQEKNNTTANMGKTPLKDLSKFIGLLNEKERQETQDDIENGSGTQTKTYSFTKGKKSYTNVENYQDNKAYNKENDHDRNHKIDHGDTNVPHESFLLVSKKMLSASIKGTTAVAVSSVNRSFTATETQNV